MQNVDEYYKFEYQRIVFSSVLFKSLISCIIISILYSLLAEYILTQLLQNNYEQDNHFYIVQIILKCFFILLIILSNHYFLVFECEKALKFKIKNLEQADKKDFFKQLYLEFLIDLNGGKKERKQSAIEQVDSQKIKKA